MKGDFTQRIYRAFGFTDEQIAEILASPEHQAYERARAEADERATAVIAGMEKLAEELSARLTRELFE